MFTSMAEFAFREAQQMEEAVSNIGKDERDFFPLSSLSFL